MSAKISETPERLNIVSDRSQLVARSEDTDKPSVLEGYAAVFNEPTIINDYWGGFEEVVAPGAFARALSEKQDVRTLFNHDSNFPLARTKNGSLIMREDSKGLWTESTLGKNSVSEAIADYVRTGLVSGMSFAFTVRRQEWTFYEPEDGKTDRRTILEIGVMYDVGPVTYPAYEQTSIKARSKDSPASVMHHEARARFDEARKRSVQVPLRYGESFCEARSGDLWVPVGIELKEANDETTDKTDPETPASPEVPTQSDAGSAPADDAANGGAQDSGADGATGRMVTADGEAIYRSIALKRRLAAVSSNTRRFVGVKSLT